MSNGTVPLSVLDLVPIAEGDSAADAVAHSVDLARRAEQLGYHRYWFAEHHLNEGVAGSAPVVMVGLVAGSTTTIRVGSAGVQMGHRTPLSVVEEFGLLDAAFPGRIDLGMGRTIGAPRPRTDEPDPATPRPRRPKPPARTVDGVFIPSPPSLRRLRGSPRAGLTRKLLHQESAITPSYAEQLADVIAFLDGTYRSADGVDAHIHPGEGAAVQIWILGSSGGESADVAGQNGLRFAANYHVSPATVLDAVEGYRAAFRPGRDLEQPHLSVSVDVVVGDDDEQAQELAAGYGPWVLAIRSGEGAGHFLPPDRARAATASWTDDDRALVADRVSTQVVGGPQTVVDQLHRIVAVTGANELVVTTMTHDHADRVRSYELLAKYWDRWP